MRHVDAALAWAATVDAPPWLEPGSPNEERWRRTLVAAVRRGFRAGAEHVVTLVDAEDRARVRAEVRALVGEDGGGRGRKGTPVPDPW